MSGQRVNFKLVFNGVKHKFGSTLLNDELFRVLKIKVAQITHKTWKDLELCWKDDESNIVLESAEDLETAIDYAKVTRKNTTTPPCIELVVTVLSPAEPATDAKVEDVVESMKTMAIAEPAAPVAAAVKVPALVEPWQTMFSPWVDQGGYLNGSQRMKQFMKELAAKQKKKAAAAAAAAPATATAVITVGEAIDVLNASPVAVNEMGKVPAAFPNITVGEALAAMNSSATTGPVAAIKAKIIEADAINAKLSEAAEAMAALKEIQKKARTMTVGETIDAINAHLLIEKEKQAVNKHFNILTEAGRMSLEYAEKVQREAAEQRAMLERKIAENKKAEEEAQLSQSLWTKPTCSFSMLIIMAIQANDEKEMSSDEICEWIAENYPYYQMEDEKWQTTVRETLSIDDCFVKAPCTSGLFGGGCFWKIRDQEVDYEIAVYDGYRRKRWGKKLATKKKSRVMKNMGEWIVTKTDSGAAVVTPVTEIEEQSRLYELIHRSVTKDFPERNSLATAAILSSERRMMTRREINKWMEKKAHPVFTPIAMTGTVLKNHKEMIRQTLKKGDNFVKIPRPVDEPGKGCYWVINPKYLVEEKKTAEVKKEEKKIVQTYEDRKKSAAAAAVAANSALQQEGVRLSLSPKKAEREETGEQAISSFCKPEAVKATEPAKTRVHIIRRREMEGRLALTLHSSLRNEGYEVSMPWIDLDEQKIKEADHVIVSLAPKSLDDVNVHDQFYKELKYAFSLNKSIIPVFDQQFEFPAKDSDIPEGIRQLSRMRGVRWVHGYEKDCLIQVEKMMKENTKVESPPGVFLAYRRDQYSELPFTVEQLLHQRGFEESSFTSAKHFIVVLTPESFEDLKSEDLFHREIQAAFFHNKTIIPIFDNDFAYPEDESIIPEDIRKITRLFGLRWSNVKQEECMDKLEKVMRDERVSSFYEKLCKDNLPKPTPEKVADAPVVEAPIAVEVPQQQQVAEKEWEEVNEEEEEKDEDEWSHEEVVDDEEEVIDEEWSCGEEEKEERSDDELSLVDDSPLEEVEKGEEVLISLIDTEPMVIAREDEEKAKKPFEKESVEERQINSDESAREKELRIREKTLEMKEETFERKVAEFSVRMEEYEMKMAKLEQRVEKIEKKREEEYDTDQEYDNLLGERERAAAAAAAAAKDALREEVRERLREQARGWKKN